jgi:molybdopterin-guanine dinucleotide biosynthesis protein A
MILGVVLAGGQSTRFGSDKALAELGGKSLLSRAVESLSQWCAKVVIAGREAGPETGETECVGDYPKAGMGPLGGIAAGLRHAQDAGYESALTCGVDSVELPQKLDELLSPAPAYLESQPVIGHWPASAAATVEEILAGNGKHSMRELAEAIGARPVKTKAKPANINTQADLSAVENQNGL